MKVVIMSSLTAKEGRFYITGLMKDNVTKETYHKERAISNNLACKILLSEKGVGALTARFSKAYILHRN